MSEDILAETDTDFLFVTPEMAEESAKDLAKHIEVTSSFERTYIVVIACHHELSKNFINKINCKKGVPIGGYVFDSQTDSYHVECTDYLQLGYIPVSFKATVKDTGWKIRVPLSEDIIKKYLTNLQKRELKRFTNLFRMEEYTIHFIQMIEPN